MALAVEPLHSGGLIRAPESFHHHKVSGGRRSAVYQVRGSNDGSVAEIAASRC